MRRARALKAVSLLIGAVVGVAIALAAVVVLENRPKPRLLTLYQDCGDGVALYRSEDGATWLWRRGLKPAPPDAACSG